ncbi:YqkE family protein [Bacillus sp. JJ634]
MSKKQSRTHTSKQQTQDDSLKLGDLINGDIMSKLRQTQKELTEAAQVKKEAEEARKREERKRREKNKSFEELLEESNLDWKNYK